MRVVLTIFLTFLLLPAFAKGKKGRGHGHHRHSHHRVAHHRHSHHRAAHGRRTIKEEIPADPLSLQFEEQKGKLQLPVYEESHRKPKCEFGCCNNSINVATSYNAPVFAVFEGTVSTVMSVEGSQIVMIRHGNYYTVYNNLSAVYVSKGQNVTAMQRIGIVGEDDDCLPSLNFQIWKSEGKKGVLKLDPEKWVACQR